MEKNNSHGHTPHQSQPAKDKKNFLFGMVSGIAIIAVIGWVITALGTPTPTTTNNPTKNNPTVAKNNPQPDNQNITVKAITNEDWVKGNRNAQISIIEFSDTECPFCKRHHPTLARIVEDYNGKVNWVYRHFPLTSLHPKAPKEAEATECAGELAGNDGFWAYLDRIFEVTPSNNRLNTAELTNIAEYIGLDKTKFQTCLDSGKYASKVKDHATQAVTAGGRGTPYNIIIAGDKKIPVSGAVPYEQLKSIIDNLL